MKDARLSKRPFSFEFSPLFLLQRIAAATLLLGLGRIAPAQAFPRATPPTESRGEIARATTLREMQPGDTELASADDFAGGAATGISASASRGVEGLPDSPDVALAVSQGVQPTAPGASTPAADVPSKRVLFIIPNYRSVAAGSILPPQTVHQKFSTALSDTIDPANFALSALVAAYDYGRGATQEFGSGGVAFGRYYWHALADQSIENISVEFLVPALTHEDTRYYTLGKGSTGKRLKYSVTRILITRTDSGKETLNLGEILGAGLASGVSSRYYPPSQRDAGSVLSSYALNLGIDAASYVVREFDVDLARAFSRKR